MNSLGENILGISDGRIEELFAHWTKMKEKGLGDSNMFFHIGKNFQKCISDN